jgi:plasmid stability protein
LSLNRQSRDTERRRKLGMHHDVPLLTAASQARHAPRLTLFLTGDAIIDSICAMAQLLVRDLEPEVVQALKRRAAEEGTSVEEAHRRLLREALLKSQPSLSFKEALLRMPDDGDDKIFSRQKKKRRQPKL